ncbi:MAG: phosphohistidine phosphatase SixA [Thermodesulfobacteriota bacterium]|nr:phosphohistidine phosphatase SixA [Thermodesulfobacteriota bacterium]
MRIYLMQHGKQVPKEEDPGRPLSDQGRHDVERMAGFLKKCPVNVEEVFHSGKTRAKETAEIMISRLNPGKDPVVKMGLSPLDDISEIAEQIKAKDNDFMIVGHLPHLARLSAFLMTGSESTPVVRFKQGGVVCLEKEEEYWSIGWMLVPEIVK